MKEKILVLVLLMAYPASSQISTGTIVIINLSKDEIVVAADSRSIDGRSAPDNSYCKIAVLRHQFVFTSVGGVKYAKGPIDIIQDWNNTDVARDALGNATKGMIIDDAYMDAVVTYWAKIIENDWNSLCRVNRGQCTNKVEPLGLASRTQPTELTGGVFVGAKGLFVRAATIDFDNDIEKLFNPVDYKIDSTLSQCWPCGQGEKICAAGSHVDVAAQFCSVRKPGTQLSVRTVLHGADEHARLAVEIVEKTIDAYEQNAGDVGGSVDAITLTKSGTMTWNARKPNCPDNQD